MNIDKARDNAIKQQIKPWGGLNYLANNALAATPREFFTPSKYKNLAFADIEIPIGFGQKMFHPKTEGRILDTLNIQKNESVLEIGTGSGYLTAVISLLCDKITSVDINEKLHLAAKDKLSQLNINNANLLVADASLGFETKDFFDAVVVGCAVPKITGRYFHLLNVGGRIFVVEGTGKSMQAKLITRVSDIDWRTDVLFETQMDIMHGLESAGKFIF